MRKLEDLSKWKLRDRTNEHGTLYEKGEGYELRLDAHIEGEDPDPKKRAEKLTQAMNTPCPTCAKLMGDHTLEEIRACARNRPKNQT